MSLKVSVIMMTYNHEKYISKAIEGVLMQRTTFSIQLIVANDHSTDATEQLVEAYRHKSPDVVKGYYNEKNLGPTHNFIKAFGQADGKYIAVCEGDDYWTDPLKLQKQVDFLEANSKYSFCSHSYNTVDKDDKFIVNTNQDLEVSEGDGFDIDFDNYFDRWVSKTLTNLFRKNDVTFNLSSYKLLTDTILIFELLLKGKGFWMNMNSGCYRIHGNSSWSSLEVIQRLKISVSIFYQLNKRHKNIAPLQKALLNKTRQVIEYLVDNNNYSYLNVIPLAHYSRLYISLSNPKTNGRKFIYERVFKKLILHYKIKLRKFVDIKYRRASEL